MDREPRTDRRVHRTRQLLLNALTDLILEQDYEKITVQDIIDRADVGRATFYSHFRDKDDLLLSGAEALRAALDAFLAQVGPGTGAWDYSLALFRHIEARRQVFKALLRQRSGNVLLEHMQKTQMTALRKHLEKGLPKNRRPVPPDVVAQYLVSGFLGLLLWWLDNDIVCSAEQLNQYYFTLAEPTMQMLMAGEKGAPSTIAVRR